MNKKIRLELLMIIVGSFIFSVAINIFVIPNNFGEGGITGTTIILYYLYEWSPGLVSFILNGLLIAVGYKFLDKKTTIYTIIAVIAISLFLHFTENWTIQSNQDILNALFGGVIVGVGLGLILRSGGTIAGSTILAKITQKYLGWSVSYGLLFFDLVVVFCSYFIIGMEKLMFTILMLYIATKVMDFIIEGLNTKKAVTIITKNPDEIAKQVNEQINRGVTVFNGYGFYTKNSKEILYVIINKQQLVELKNIIKSIDQTAFVTIHDVRDVFGKGFVDINKN
ncbi:YitT family protein [Lysinibacillus telephonicus]|uniref:YitT family protein n=1 Tax=Lysinibacillus telephonicus TaxID=1714840 RepID=A0A431UV63_9BACI|nr:YitT family protein [Lysinibacillus telephonicus]RTQ94905.1 YitT family protein [Lysinibacillus telephonicus]